MRFEMCLFNLAWWLKTEWDDQVSTLGTWFVIRGILRSPWNLIRVGIYGCGNHLARNSWRLMWVTFFWKHLVKKELEGRSGILRVKFCFSFLSLWQLIRQFRRIFQHFGKAYLWRLRHYVGRHLVPISSQILILWLFGSRSFHNSRRSFTLCFVSVTMCSGQA